MKVSLIVACTLDGGIGYKNRIPWNIPEDLKKFRKITTKSKDPNKINAVIMGRNTWESINIRLPNRVNIVVTSNRFYKIRDENVIVAHSLASALAYCDRLPYIENVFIIGGADLYNIFINEMRHMIDKIYLSVMFYNPNHIADRCIDMDVIFQHFRVYKDGDFSIETDKRLFASFICEPK